MSIHPLPKKILNTTLSPTLLLLQVTLICKVLGKPTEEEMTHITSDSSRKFLASLPETKKMSFSTLLQNSSHAANFDPAVNNYFPPFFPFPLLHTPIPNPPSEEILPSLPKTKLAGRQTVLVTSFLFVSI